MKYLVNFPSNLLTQVRWKRDGEYFRISASSLNQTLMTQEIGVLGYGYGYRTRTGTRTPIPENFGYEIF